MTTPEEKTKAQTREFEAVANLSRHYAEITYTSVVDDDYGEVRHKYESALAVLIEQMRKNGRFESGNRYNLRDIAG